MNKYTRNMKSGSRKPYTAKKNTDPWIFKLMIICTLMLGTIFATFVLRLSLNNRTEILTRQAESIKFQIEEKEREILNLKNKREVLCSWDNIKKKIKEYNLALRPTEYQQIKYMKRYKISYEDESTAAMLAATDSNGEKQSVSSYAGQPDQRLASY